MSDRLNIFSKVGRINFLLNAGDGIPKNPAEELRAIIFIISPNNIFSRPHVFQQVDFHWKIILHRLTVPFLEIIFLKFLLQLW